jgi:uncharacterized membrane protein YphA (DoxX/SURF4 family)
VQTFKPSFFLIVTLVALRVAIGTHFFREGLNKLRDPKPFSAGFFGSAKGPLAEPFHNLVWDKDGLSRLNLAATLKAWDQFRARVERKYGFDDNQKKRAAEVLKRYEAQLREYIEDKSGDIHEYRGNLERHHRYRQDSQRMETPSLRAQVEKIEGELRTKRNQLVGSIDSLWTGYANELNALATPNQQGYGPIELSKAGRRMLDSEGIDRFIPWFDATIGVLLVIGLFTRPAALLAAAFLFSVLATQWPFSPNAIPTWPQFIEALGLLVVAAAGAGRYAGLDALLAAIFARQPRPNRRGNAA